MNLLKELSTYLDTLFITGDNIGQIRASLFMPWESEWNGLVRDETARREISSVGGVPTKFYSVYFHCGCSRTPNAGGMVTDRRCADNNCQRLGRQ